MHERRPPIKIILVPGALKLPDIDIPPDSRLSGKPLKAEAMIAEMQQMIGHAWRRRHPAEKGDNRSIVPETTSQLM